MPTGLLMLMRGHKGGVTSDKETPGESSDDNEDYVDAAGEIIDAIHNNDKEALAEALKNFVSACC